ncbi:glycosyltransferase family 4 protein [Candidatus Methylacidiphilum infernorum]|uniref:Glycosyltransferase family 4 protein n=1 Tax=Candidatus Methylacidiphilum infernorum TaxID=511746 RepID=A0ABX7PXG3_9BACT|nr:glycosyltransferase family 4 protein [Candidatus Methylacidiphilum infernorum]QSR87279.1 glycosyltransferase family 4 protein [Candidatus Methylacidiphilum infernorum]
MRPLRLAVVSMEYGYEGGAEKFVWEITERMSCIPGLEVHLLASRWKRVGPQIVCHKIPLFKINRYSTRLSFCWNAYKMIRRGNFDLVHSHELVLNSDVVTFGVPHLFWVREIQKKRSLSLYNRLINFLEKKTLYSQNLSWILPNSGHALKAFAQYYPDLLPKVKVINPGVAFERFNRDLKDRELQRKRILDRFGWDRADLVGIFVGNNWQLKGLLQVCYGLAEAKKRGLRVNLLVVGRGNRDEISRFLKLKGIESQVGFTGLITEEIEHYYQAADFLVLLSRFESFGMVVLEAMASALPVILSPDVGAWDVAEEGVNALKIENPEDPKVLAAAFGKLAQPELRKQLSDNALQTAKKNGWQKALKETLKIYGAVLEKKKLHEKLKRQLDFLDLI